MKLSRHALEQARQKGVSINEIRKAIQRGAKHFQGAKIVADFIHIRVVYRIINKDPFVITVMIKR